MRIIDRDGKEVIVDQSQNNYLKALYSHVIGRCVLKVLTLPFITSFGGAYMNSGFSRRKIKPFIQKNNIDMSQYVIEDFKSYNDFFTRKIKEGKRPIALDKNALISPADSKLMCYSVDEELILNIKDTRYKVEELLENKELAKQYKEGTCLIFRLTVDDYHRYNYIDNGYKEEDIYIPGRFHTVNPIANDYYPIYKQNSRSYSLLHTENFDDVIYMEVGAMMVGRIVNHPLAQYKKGEEKGYFEFGGSTIVLLLKKDIVTIDADIIENSAKNNETKVRLGEKIGIKNKNPMIK